MPTTRLAGTFGNTSLTDTPSQSATNRCRVYVEPKVPPGRSPQDFLMPMSTECAAGLVKHLVHALSKLAPELLLSMADK
jgi:hypothetical protein